jgi:hypothetical protein
MSPHPAAFRRRALRILSPIGSAGPWQSTPQRIAIVTNENFCQKPAVQPSPERAAEDCVGLHAMAWGGQVGYAVAIHSYEDKLASENTFSRDSISGRS